MLPPGNGKPAFIPGLQIRQMNDRYLQICILNNPLVSFDLYFNIRHVLRTFQSARPMGAFPRETLTAGMKPGSTSYADLRAGIRAFRSANIPALYVGVDVSLAKWSRSSGEIAPQAQDT